MSGIPNPPTLSSAKITSTTSSTILLPPPPPPNVQTTSSKIVTPLKLNPTTNSTTSKSNGTDNKSNTIIVNTSEKIIKSKPTTSLSTPIVANKVVTLTTICPPLTPSIVSTTSPTQEKIINTLSELEKELLELKMKVKYSNKEITLEEQLKILENKINLLKVDIQSSDSSNQVTNITNTISNKTTNVSSSTTTTTTNHNNNNNNSTANNTTTTNNTTNMNKPLSIEIIDGDIYSPKSTRSSEQAQSPL